MEEALVQSVTQSLSSALPDRDGQENAALGAAARRERVGGSAPEQDISEKIRLAKSYWKKKKVALKAVCIGKNLYQNEDYRCGEVIRELSNDLNLADASVETYVSHFDFRFMSLESALYTFLQALWPEDEVKLQHLFLWHFSLWFLKCNERPLHFHQGLYILCWAMILLNADLHGSHRGTKMTCDEFIVNLNRVSEHFSFSPDFLNAAYILIKTFPLRSFAVKSRRRPVNDEPAGTIRSKTGRLVCKRVREENGRKTRLGRRSWRPFNASLKGMVLQLDSEREGGENITLRLHHALAHSLKYKDLPDVLYLKTADCRVFYLQAESAAEQSSWIDTINLIAARYSAPPLDSATNTKSPLPRVLPSFPSPLSLQQQLQYTRERFHKFSEYMIFYQTVPFSKDQIPSDYMEQEVRRYTTYVRVLEKTVRDKDADVHEFLPQKKRLIT